MGEVTTPEQAVAFLMADKIQCWVDELPKWRDMPEIMEREANFKKTVAITQIAKATSRLMRSTSEVLVADIDCVLGHQTRISLELFFDTAWLRMNDNNGKLSEQFMIWHTKALYEANGKAEYGKSTMQEAWNRYGDTLNNPDGWTVTEGGRRITNANNRRKEVARKLAGRDGLEELSGMMDRMFRALNALSHSLTATVIGGKAVLAFNILTGCYLTIRECQDWLLEMTGGLPDEESESASKELWEFANVCLADK